MGGPLLLRAILHAPATQAPGWQKIGQRWHAYHPVAARLVSMDIYHIWFNLKDGVRDMEFAQNTRSYLDHLKELGSIAGYRISRRKLGLGPPQLPLWNITIDFE